MFTCGGDYGFKKALIGLVVQLAMAVLNKVVQRSYRGT